MPVLLPVAKVLDLCNPFESWPWAAPVVDDDFKLTWQAIQESLDSGTWVTAQTHQSVLMHYSDLPITDQFWYDYRQYHIDRVAALFMQGWSDPIDLDVGCPALLCHVDWPLQDGHHRLAAAVFRGDEFILASVGGDLDYAFELFGVDCEEPCSK